MLPLGGTGVLLCLEALDSRNVCVYAQHMDTTQDTMRPRTIRMTDAMWKALDDLAYARRIRAADVAREAIETYLVASHQGAAQNADPSARIIGKPSHAKPGEASQVIHTPGIPGTTGHEHPAAPVAAPHEPAPSTTGAGEGAGR